MIIIQLNLSLKDATGSKVSQRVAARVLYYSTYNYSYLFIYFNIHGQQRWIIIKTNNLSARQPKQIIFEWDRGEVVRFCVWAIKLQQRMTKRDDYDDHWKSHFYFNVLLPWIVM